MTDILVLVTVAVCAAALAILSLVVGHPGGAAIAWVAAAPTTIWVLKKLDDFNALKEKALRLDPNTIYQVKYSWVGGNKPVLNLIPYGRGPTIQSPVMDPPPDFKKVISPDGARAYWIPNDLYKNGEKLWEPVFNTYY